MQNTMLDSTTSNYLQLFENTDWKIRVIMRDGEPWFVASDVCKCLELKDDAGTICRELDEQDKVTLSREEFAGGVSNRGIICSVDARVQSLVFVSESGMYDIVIMSRKPEAKAFKRWVTHDVIPSIRKTGGYGIRTVDDMINDPDTAIRLLTQLKIMRLQNKQLEMERDEAVRTKAMIGSRREATAMATASAKSKECKRLETENELLKQDFITNPEFCRQLLAQNLVVYAESTLNGKCSKALKELTALMEKPTLNWNEWNDKAGKEVPRTAYHKDVCAELKQRILDNPKYLRRF